MEETHARKTDTSTRPKLRGYLNLEELQRQHIQLVLLGSLGQARSLRARQFRRLQPGLEEDTRRALLEGPGLPQHLPLQLFDHLCKIVLAEALVPKKESTK